MFTYGATRKGMGAPMLLRLRSMSDCQLRRTRLHSFDSGFSLAEMMVVLAFMGALAAIALPVLGRALAAMRLSGTARDLSNATALAKTKAAAEFTRARLFADLGAESFHVEVWNTTTNQWDAATGITALPVNVSYGWGPVTTAAGTQQPFGQAPQCLDNASNPMANTACIVFNSRGIPINNALAPTAADGLYITDGNSVLGVTVAPTGLIGLFTTPSQANPAWTLS